MQRKTQTKDQIMVCVYIRRERISNSHIHGKRIKACEIKSTTHHRNLSKYSILETIIFRNHIISYIFKLITIEASMYSKALTFNDKPPKWFS